MHHLIVAAAAGMASFQSPSPRVIDLPPPNATLSVEFTMVSAVRELVDGRALVVDRSEKKLVVADWSTGQVRQLGRSGSGPGEYVQPTALLALAGDSTILPDARNGRWLLLHGSTIVGTVGAESPPIRNGARLPLGADMQGRVIVARPAGAVRTALPRLDSFPLVRISRATGETETLEMLKARTASITLRGPKDKPISVEVLIHPLATGEQAALFPDRWIVIARLDPYRVDWIAPDGRKVRGEPLPFERVRLDDREQRGFVERQAMRNGGEVRDPKSFPEWPAMMPPFLEQALLAAPDGRVWIQRAPTVSNPDPPYDVVDRKGAMVARIKAGKDVQVVGFGRAAVYTVSYDDNGIQHLQRRPLPAY